jgi:non-haem Fe2+, alpha-ketoglutarate-dependent halogenase
MKASLGKQLSDVSIAQFREKGYFTPVSVLSAAEVSKYQHCFNEFEKKSGGKLMGHQRNMPHLFLKWLDELVRHPKILDAVEDLLGPNILLYHAQFFVKEPHTPDFVSFHQDSAYWSLSEAQGLSTWIALFDADLESGCMEVVPGSHVKSIAHVDRKEDNNMLFRGQTVDVEAGEIRSVPMPLAAGEMSIHHARIIHGSGPNRSNRRRIGYSARYIPTHIARTGARDSAVLVRGVDSYHHFDLQPRPISDYEPAAVAIHKAVTERYMRNYLGAAQEDRAGAK